MTEQNTEALRELTVTVLLALACPLILPLLEDIRHD